MQIEDETVVKQVGQRHANDHEQQRAELQSDPEAALREMTRGEQTCADQQKMLQRRFPLDGLDQEMLRVIGADIVDVAEIDRFVPAVDGEGDPEERGQREKRESAQSFQERRHGEGALHHQQHERIHPEKPDADECVDRKRDAHHHISQNDPVGTEKPDG